MEKARSISEIKSIMTRKELETTAKEMGLGSDFRLRLPRGDERANQVGERSVPMYKEYVRYGVRVSYLGPLSVVLKGWNIFPTLFIPSAWRLIVAVVSLVSFCWLRFDFEILLSVFVLRKCAIGGANEDWYCIQPRKESNWKFYYRETLDRSWKRKFFFVEFLKESLLPFIPAEGEPLISACNPFTSVSVHGDFVKSVGRYCVGKGSSIWVDTLIHDEMLMFAGLLLNENVKIERAILVEKRAMEVVDSLRFAQVDDLDRVMTIKEIRNITQKKLEAEVSQPDEHTPEEGHHRRKRKLVCRSGSNEGDESEEVRKEREESGTVGTAGENLKDLVIVCDEENDGQRKADLGKEFVAGPMELLGEKETELANEMLIVQSGSSSVVAPIDRSRDAKQKGVAVSGYHPEFCHLDLEEARKFADGIGFSHKESLLNQLSLEEGDDAVMNFLLQAATFVKFQRLRKTRIINEMHGKLEENSGVTAAATERIQELTIMIKKKEGMLEILKADLQSSYEISSVAISECEKLDAILRKTEGEWRAAIKLAEERGEALKVSEKRVLEIQQEYERRNEELVEKLRKAEEFVRRAGLEESFLCGKENENSSGSQVKGFAGFLGEEIKDMGSRVASLREDLNRLKKKSDGSPCGQIS